MSWVFRGYQPAGKGQRTEPPTLPHTRSENYLPWAGWTAVKQDELLTEARSHWRPKTGLLELQAGGPASSTFLPVHPWGCSSAELQRAPLPPRSMNLQSVPQAPAACVVYRRWAEGCLPAGEQLILSQLKSYPSQRTREARKAGQRIPPILLSRPWVLVLPQRPRPRHHQPRTARRTSLDLDHLASLEGLVSTCARSVVFNSALAWTAAARLLCPWNFPGKNTGAGGHFLLQGIFRT